MRRGRCPFAGGLHRAHNVVSAPRKNKIDFMNPNKWNFFGLKLAGKGFIFYAQPALQRTAAIITVGGLSPY